MDCYLYVEAGLWNGAHCCWSCHEDASEGYDCVWIEVHGEELHVCCSLAEQVDVNSLPPQGKGDS